MISVMGVALRYPFGSVRAQLRPVSILLLMAMPAMALISTGLTAAILGVTLGAALVLGTAICPTDPVLASSVVTGKPAEEDLPARDRQILSLESGANDGLALLFVLAAVAFAGPMSAGRAAADALWQVLGAVALGVLAGWLGGRALRAGEAHGATAHGPMLLFTVLLALLVLGLSGVLHVDGVLAAFVAGLAAFVAGLAFNLTSTGSERPAEVKIDEAVNRFAVLPMFVLLGATLPWTVWGELGWAAIALALAVLMLRRLPALLLLKRPLNLGWPDALYLGWFGPVGVSAVFYLTLEAEELGLPETVMAAGIMIVVVSTVAHGVTSSARPVALPAPHGRDPDRTASARGLALRHAVSGSPPGATRQIEKTLQRAPAAMPSARLRPAVTTAVVADQARGTNAPGTVRAGGSPRP